MKKIAIVYDWMDKWGGVERMLLILHELFPHAVFYTSFVDYDTAIWAQSLNPRTSYMQRLPRFILRNRVLSLPFFTYAFESFNLREYDVVISVSSSFAKGVVTDHHTKHISIILTPPRFLWQGEENYKKGGMVGWVLKRRLREWDVVAAERPDTLLAISKTVANRCKKYYKRDSLVVYPPFDSNYWDTVKSKLLNTGVSKELVSDLSGSRFGLVVSRLERYKRIDIAVDAFRDGALSKHYDKLVIVGKGTEEKRLKIRAGSSKLICFYQSITDTDLAWLYHSASAHIMPQEEDFGYTSIEAQFFHCPVVAFSRGGASETVIDGKTGILFDMQTPSSLIEALARLASMKYNLSTVNTQAFQNNVAQYDKAQFATVMKDITNL